MRTRAKQRGAVYLRRSSATQEASLRDQLAWAIDEAMRRGITLECTLDDLTYMMANGVIVRRGMYLDDAVSGAVMDRPGLGQLVNDALCEPRDQPCVCV